MGKIDSEYLKELQGSENGYDMVLRECKKVVELSLDKWITSGLLVGVGFQLMSRILVGASLFG